MKFCELIINYIVNHKCTYDTHLMQIVLSYIIEMKKEFELK